MAFNNLPVEVIDNICLRLRDCKNGTFRSKPNYQPAAKKALRNLCRTSKQLLQIARPHLYHRGNINGYEASLVSFTRLLFDNPHLADLVHEIELDQYYELEHDQTLEDYFSVQLLLLPTPDSEANGIPTGSEEWYTVRVLDLLLTKARNLEFIDITDTPYDEGFGDGGFADIRAKHMTDTQFLSKLKECVVRHWDTEDGFQLDTIVDLVDSTQIQTLTLYACTRLIESANRSFPSLLELKILDSGLCDSEVAAIVEWCPNVQHFTYGVGSAAVTQGERFLVTPEGVTSAILPLRKSLRTLFLHLPFEDALSSDPIGSLVQFSRLDSLTIDINALAGEVDGDYDSWCRASPEQRILRRKASLSGWLNKLPKSLQNLCIVQSTKALHSELSSLAERSIDFPNLTTLTVDHPLGMAALFRRTNIEYLEIEPNSMINDLEW